MKNIKYVFFKDAIRKPSAWEFVCSRLFGTTMIAEDHSLKDIGCRLHAKEWRGKLYVIKFEFIDNSSMKESR